MGYGMRTAEVRCYLSLGSNLDDREKNLRKAVSFLSDHSKIKVTEVSSIYQTSPVEYIDQPSFLNIVLEALILLSPFAFLKVCQKVEKKIGRKGNFRYGPRKIDVDILLYDEIVIDEEKLQIPHPKMLFRKFVLIPLLEINDKAKHPEAGDLKVLLSRLKNDDKVDFFKKW